MVTSALLQTLIVPSPPPPPSLSLDAPSGKCVSKIDNYSDAVSSSFDLFTLHSQSTHSNQS